MFNEFVLSNVWRKLSLSRAINVYHRIKVKRIATTRRARFAANKNRVSRDWRGRWGTSSRRNLAIPAVPLADDYPRTSIIYPAAISDDRDSESPTDRMHTIRRRPSSIAVLPRAQILIPQTQFGNFLFSTGSSGRVKMRRDGKRRTKSVRRAGAPRSRVVVEEWKKKKSRSWRRFCCILLARSSIPARLLSCRIWLMNTKRCDDTCTTHGNCLDSSIN